MQINSFRTFFKFILGKKILSIYLRGVKIANYYFGMLTCDRVSSGSDPLFLDDCSLFFFMFKFIFRLFKVRKINKQPKTCPFFCFCKKATCVRRYLSSFTVFASDTILVAKCFKYVLMLYIYIYIYIYIVVTELRVLMFSSLRGCRGAIVILEVGRGVEASVGGPGSLLCLME